MYSNSNYTIILVHFAEVKAISDYKDYLHSDNNPNSGARWFLPIWLQFVFPIFSPTSSIFLLSHCSTPLPRSQTLLTALCLCLDSVLPLSTISVSSQSLSLLPLLPPRLSSLLFELPLFLFLCSTTVVSSDVSLFVRISISHSSVFISFFFSFKHCSHWLMESWWLIMQLIRWNINFASALTSQSLCPVEMGRKCGFKWTVVDYINEIAFNPAGGL